MPNGKSIIMADELQLWDYQQAGVDFFHGPGQHRCIIGDEMGLGKTGIALKAWQRGSYRGPALLLGRVNALAAWYRQCPMWGCPRPLIVRGNAGERARMWSALKTHVQKGGHKDGLFYATTREAFRIDVARGAIDPAIFRCVMIDEAHRDANRKRSNYKLAKQVCGNDPKTWVMLLTGTPLKRGGTDLWGLLNICRPWQFKSYWKFIEDYFFVDKNGAFGWEVFGLKNPTALQEKLAETGAFLCRTKKQVKADMPPKIRDIGTNEISMSLTQRVLYNAILEDGVALLSNGTDVAIAPSVLTRITRLRQILCCPKILDPNCTDWGNGIERIIEMLQEMDDKHVVIFTPFTAALPHIRSCLYREGFMADEIVDFRGGMSPEELANRVAYFQEHRCIALCSISFAESFDLTPSLTGIFLGFDWDAFANMQAEDRLHRGDLKEPVNIYYITYKDGLDTKLMMGALDTKVNNAHQVLHNVEAIRKLFQEKVTTST